MLTRTPAVRRRTRPSSGSGASSSPIRPTPLGSNRNSPFASGRTASVAGMDLVERQPDGRVGITDYKSSDVRDPATANRRSRESLQLGSMRWPGRRSRGLRPTSWRCTFSIRDSSVVPIQREPAGQKAAEQVARRPPGFARVTSRRRPDRRSAVTARSATSARTRPGEWTGSRLGRRPLAAAVLAALLVVVMASQTCPGSTASNPCPEAPVNRGIVIGLAAAAVGLLVTALALLGRISDAPPDCRIAARWGRRHPAGPPGGRRGGGCGRPSAGRCAERRCRSSWSSRSPPPSNGRFSARIADDRCPESPNPRPGGADISRPAPTRTCSPSVRPRARRGDRGPASSTAS